MSQLVILNYSTSTIDVYNINSETMVDEAYITTLGYNLEECSWMYANELSINFHTQVLNNGED